jgi:phosphocarrier protein HPr
MRPAAKFVQTASKFGSSVTVIKGPEKVNGKSIMEMMLLEAVKGTKLNLACEGDDADACLDALAELVRNKFDEE